MDRWLGKADDDAWAQILALVEYLPAALDVQLKRDSGLGRFEYGVLAAVAGSEGHTVPMLDLSQLTFSSISRLSHTVSRMVERGLIVKQRTGGCRMISLTDAGWTALRESTPGHLREVRRQIFDLLPEGGAAELTRLLKPVVDRLKTEAPRS
jgi:DNA-binding MarR family transcriptional regulator